MIHIICSVHLINSELSVLLCVLMKLSMKYLLKVIVTIF